MKPICLLLLLLAVAANAAHAEAFWPGVTYDDAVPTYEEVLGYGPGEHISSHAEVRRWFEALAAAAPDRVRIVPYATSWQGRELFYAVIARPERLASLPSLKADIGRVANVERGAEDVLAALPATVWLSYAVHGNEVSSTDAAMLTAYHLLAAVEDPVVERILDDAVVFIDPIQNPDGRDRFIGAFEGSLGLEAHATRLAAEHDEPWPSGRVNHYLFDLNRDWLPLTQPETIGRVTALQQWYPLVYVDAHEMGSDSTYFFAPEAVPYNPHLAPSQKTNLELFGRNNARWFDTFGFPYFTREVYDAFYPGYGASWPSYYGAIAMTYEQASPRGLVVRRTDGSEFTYADAVRQHFVASVSTAEAAAVNRERLWNDFHAYRQSAVAEGEREAVRAWAIPAQADQGGADALAGLLARHGVRVYAVDDTLRACGQSLEAGSWIVPLAQPAKRFVRVAMDPNVPMADDFLERQEERRARDLPDEIYDVTAWSLPLMFNVDAVACDRAPDVDDLARLDPAASSGKGTIGGTGELAYLAKGGDRASTRLLAAALRAGLTVRVASEAFSLEDQSWPSGTLVILASDHGADLRGRLEALAAETGARLTATATSWVTDGPSFGSEKVATLRAPRVALAWDRPTSIYSPGATRFIIERKFGYPVVPIRTGRLAQASLDAFDVIILPDAWGGAGGYQQVLGSAGAENLASWVEAGGVLVTLAGGTEWAAHESVELLAVRLENKPGSEPEVDEEASEPTRVPGTELTDSEGFRAAIQPERAAPDPVAGTLVRAEVDGAHWLGAGIAETVNVLVRGDRVFTPIKLDAGVNVARYSGGDELVAGGHLWDENRRQLAFKPFLVIEKHGAGMVIGFAEDPTVRAYLDGLETLLMNAVLVAPGYSEKSR